MFVKVTPHLQSRIASNLTELEGKTDPTDGHYYRVKQQIPGALQAMRQHFNKIITEVQEKNKGRPPAEKVPFYFQGNHLYVGGKRVKEPVDPPVLSSLLNITSVEQKVLDAINIEPLATDECEGSKFYAYVIRVYSFGTIEKIYLCLRQQHMTTDHIMLGYRLAEPDSPEQCVEGSCHDGESHRDLTLAQAIADSQLKNVAVFVVCYSGPTPLRGQRLKVIGDCAKAALYKIQFPNKQHPTSPTDDDNALQHEQEQAEEPSPHFSIDHQYGRISPRCLTG